MRLLSTAVGALCVLAFVAHCGSTDSHGRGAGSGGVAGASGGSAAPATAGTDASAGGAGGRAATGGAAGSGVAGGSAAGTDSGTADAPDDADANVTWIPIDGPMEITAPGYYRVESDLSQPATTLFVHDTSDVHIDCNNHSITSTATTDGALRIDNTQRFSLGRCTVRAGIDALTTYGLTLNSVSGGNIGKNVLWAVNVSTASDLTLTGNTIHLYYQAQKSTQSTIDGNTFVGDSSMTTAGSVVLDYGSDNIVRNNHIDGSWDGTLGNTLGADDGVILQSESRDRVDNNTIVNTWDCGIETVGVVTDTSFDDNVVTKSGFCCIGAWYGNAWQNNGVSRNRCSDVASLFVFRRYFALASDETQLLFRDNVFDSNTQLTGGYEAATVFDFVDLPAEIPPTAVNVGNNRFANNTFGGPTPVLIPASMFVDLGGNACQHGTDATFPFPCGRP